VVTTTSPTIREEVSMRNIIKPGLLALAFLGLYSGSARAAEFNIHVPFSFEVGKHTLPAGEYVVDRVDQDDPNVILIKSKNLHAKAAVIVSVDPIFGK
jgi:hypothetical protein